MEPDLADCARIEGGSSSPFPTRIRSRPVGFWPKMKAYSWSLQLRLP